MKVLLVIFVLMSPLTSSSSIKEESLPSLSRQKRAFCSDLFECVAMFVSVINPRAVTNLKGFYDRTIGSVPIFINETQTGFLLLELEENATIEETRLRQKLSDAVHAASVQRHKFQMMRLEQVREQRAKLDSGDPDAFYFDHYFLNDNSFSFDYEDVPAGQFGSNSTVSNETTSIDKPT